MPVRLRGAATAPSSQTDSKDAEAAHTNGYGKHLKPAIDPTHLAAARAAANTGPRTPRQRILQLQCWNDLPLWQRDNQYILAYYRPASYSYAECFQSLFYLHNESVNVHSHLLGGFLIAFTAVAVLYFEWNRLDIADVLALSCFFFGAVVCLGMSATYHLISNHSADVARWGNQLDYAGIVALITGSFVPSVYYGFYCEPMLQRVYWAMIVSLGVACTTTSLHASFRTPQWRPFRAGMFVAMGLSAVFPVLHGVMRYGTPRLHRSIGLFWLVLQGVLYVLGAGLYAARIPERWYPGKFDLFASSHQIFHVLIVLAALAHLIGLLIGLDTAKSRVYC